MALEVGRLVAYIEADDSKLDEGLSRSQSSFSKFGSFLGTVIKTAGTAVLGVGIAAGTMGVTTAAGMEQAKIGFTTMLGSAKAAGTFLNQLSAFAANTPFEFPELQTAASSLVSAGVAAGDVIPIMTSLGNATAGMGTGSDGIKRATVALQQMNAAGKISGEDLNQLRDAGIPVYDLLAAATGKSVAAVSDLANKGKLGRKELEQLMAALKSGAGLERFAGLMDAQSQSLNGLVSTLKDNLSQGLATAVQPLIPMIKQGLGMAISFVAEQMPKLQVGLAKTVVVAQQFIKGVSMEKLAKGAAPLDGFVAKGYAARQMFLTVKSAAEGLYALVVQGNFTTGLATALHVDEDSTAVTVILKIRNAAIGLYDLIVNGDFSGNLRRAFNVEEDSGFVTWVMNARTAVIGFFTDLRAGDTGTMTTDLSSLGQSIQTLGPLLGDAFSSFQSVTSILPSFSELVHGGAVALAFLADHADLLPPILTAIAIGYGAMKVAQTLNQVAMIADIPIRAGVVASNFALAASNRALAAAINGTTDADNVNRLARIRNAISTAAAWVASSAQTVGALALQGAAFVASRVVMLAGAAVTGVVTAAQWALNAAMSANPIALVVIAIAALVAGLVIAYRNSETFRNIVNGAWTAVRVGVGAVVGWLTAAVPAVFSFIKDAFLRFTILGVVISHWSQIQGFISGAVAGIRGTIGWFAGLPGMIGGWFGAARDAAVSRFTGLVTWVQGIPGMITSALGNLSGLLVDAGSNVVSGLISGIAGMGGQLVSFVKDFVASHIPGPVAQALGISSPSRVMADKVGRWIPLGIAEGLGQTAPDLDRAMKKLVTVPGVPRSQAAASSFGAEVGAGPALANGGGGLTVMVQNPWTGEYADARTVMVMTAQQRAGNRAMKAGR